MNRRAMFWCVGALAGCTLLSVTCFSPDGAARSAIALCDEVDVEPVVVSAMTIDGSTPPEPRCVVLRLRGGELRRFRSLLEVQDAHGAMCMCDGDYGFRFLRWHVPLASFRAHVRETPAHLNGSFGVLSLDPVKAHQLFSLLSRAMEEEKRVHPNKRRV